jgi:CheY-like chemotaxis protein
LSVPPRRIVVCVDDNPEVLQALRRQLRLGLEVSARVEVASDPAQALARLEALAPRADEAVLIVSDWLMPGMRGEELVRAIEARWGALATVVLSGHITAESTKALEAMPQVAAILRKPWSSEELLALVTALLARNERPGAARPVGETETR